MSTVELLVYADDWRRVLEAAAEEAELYKKAKASPTDERIAREYQAAVKATQDAVIAMAASMAPKAGGPALITLRTRGAS